MLKDRRKPWQRDQQNFKYSRCGHILLENERAGKATDRRRSKADHGWSGPALREYARVMGWTHAETLERVERQHVAMGSTSYHM